MIAPRRRLSVIATMLGVGTLLLGFGCTQEPPPPVPTAEQPCPQWVIFPLDSHSEQDSPYLGCTTAFNLRAMVASPEDLEHGRPLGPADGERETRAIEAYKLGKVKPFQGSSASGSSGSSGSMGSTTSGGTGQ